MVSRTATLSASNLGPIDPQFGATPAHGIIEEFKRAHAEIKADPSKIPVWQPIIAKYAPTLIGECEKAIKWSEVSPMDQRVRFIADLQRKYLSLSELCRHFGVSRKTAYK